MGFGKALLCNGSVATQTLRKIVTPTKMVYILACRSPKVVLHRGVHQGFWDVNEFREMSMSVLPHIAYYATEATGEGGLNFYRMGKSSPIRKLQYIRPMRLCANGSVQKADPFPMMCRTIGEQN